HADRLIFAPAADRRKGRVRRGCVFTGLRAPSGTDYAGSISHHGLRKRGLETQRRKAGSNPGSVASLRPEEARLGRRLTVEKLGIQPPVVQVAIDVLSIDEALRIAEAAVRAGVDWLEAGTPLITFAGVQAIGALARAFPGVPVLADYKMMDGVRKYV